MWVIANHGEKYKTSKGRENKRVANQQQQKLSKERECQIKTAKSNRDAKDMWIMSYLCRSKIIKGGTDLEQAE